MTRTKKETKKEAPVKEVEKVEDKEVQKDVEKKEPETLTPKEYFDLLKGKREEADIEQLKQLYENASILMKKYTITGQKAGAMKLYNFAEVCAKEIRAVEAGIKTYVNRFDLDEYIAKIATKDVVIMELENYERDIPDDVVDKIADLKEKEIFDNFYIVFTDYTGKERKKVEQKKREKDPILFGTMTVGNQMNTRLYYICDWVDEYCDLTLDKMVKEFKKKKKDSPVYDIKSEYPTREDLENAFKERK